MTTPKWLDLKISLGNILSILTIVFGLTAGWFTMVQSVERNAAETIALANRVAKAEQLIDRVVQEAQSERLSLTTVLTQLQSDVRYMRDAIDELKRRGN